MRVYAMSRLSDMLLEDNNKPLDTQELWFLKDALRSLEDDIRTFGETREDKEKMDKIKARIAKEEAYRSQPGEKNPDVDASTSS